MNPLYRRRSSLAIFSIVILFIWKVIRYIGDDFQYFDATKLLRSNVSIVDPIIIDVTGSNALAAQVNETEAGDKQSDFVTSTPVPLESLPMAEQLHLNDLNSVCVATRRYQQDAPVIPWTYNSPTINESSLIFKDDPNLFDKLSNCPEIEVYIPGTLRDHGYCEDSMSFVKYLRSMGVPRWLYEITIPHNNRNYTYFDICPNTSTIFFNHYWDSVPDMEKWPQGKAVIMMPNIEMYEMRETLLWRADFILCRSRDCETRINMWYRQEGNSRNTRVFNIMGSSSDPTALVRSKYKDANDVPKKDFEHITFLHTPGGSIHKGTPQVFECWKDKPSLPNLTVLSSSNWIRELYENMYGGDKKQGNVKLLASHLDALEFGKLFSEATGVLCPSNMEGYGHYINQARAAGALVVTSNAPPMNELVDESSGVLIKAQPIEDGAQILGGTYQQAHGLKGVVGIRAQVSASALCEAVSAIVNAMSVQERERRAKNARKRYENDLLVFKKRMEELKDIVASFTHVSTSL